MRFILLLVLISAFNVAGLSQERPSQKQMEAQMRQAKKDAQEQISSLEKEIAVAKANNEDPEAIKEMETRLATLKQIVGGVDKIGDRLNQKQPDDLPPSKIVEPKYVSPFVPILIKQPVVAPSEGQAKDQLLWYTGRRIDANTLVTTTGMVVRYDRANNRIIVQPDKRVDTFYYGLLKTLAQTSQMRNGFVARINGMKNSFFMYPEIQNAYNDFYDFRDSYYDVAKNTFDVRWAVPHQPLEILHHQLIVSMATLSSPRNISLPPQRPNDLCDCDKRKLKQYKIDLDQWLLDFSHDETVLLNLIASIYTEINASGITLPNLDGDILKAFNLVVERLSEKLEELTNRYKSNVHIEGGLVLFATYFQSEILGQRVDRKAQSTKNLIGAAQEAIWQAQDLVWDGTVFEKYVQDQIAALNFNAVFDISLYENHELNRKICRDYNNVEENIEKWVERLDKFNRFALSMELDFAYEISEGEEKALEANGSLRSDYVIVMLGKDECGWHLSLKDPDHRERRGDEEIFQIPFNVLAGRKIIYTKPPLIFDYSGPAKMNMISPVFKIDLCPNATNDRAYVEGLRFSDADIAAHANDNFSKMYTTDLFQYVNKMFVMVMGVKDNSANLISGAFEMMNLSTGNISTRPPSTGNRTLDQMMMEYLMWLKKNELLQKVTQTTHTGNTVVPFDAKNGNNVLISTTYSLIDPGDKDRSVGIKMTTANITIRVTHSPL